MNLTPIMTALAALSVFGIIISEPGSAKQCIAIMSTPFLIWIAWAAYRVNEKRKIGRATPE
jgi:threonine/homoserine/homoserine lactone efflux protein